METVYSCSCDFEDVCGARPAAPCLWQTDPWEHCTSTGGSAVSEMWQKLYPPVLTQQPAATQVTSGSQSGFGSCLWIAAQHLVLLWITDQIRCSNISPIFSVIAEWPLVQHLFCLLIYFNYIYHHNLVCHNYGCYFTDCRNWQLQMFNCCIMLVFC